MMKMEITKMVNSLTYNGEILNQYNQPPKCTFYIISMDTCQASIV